MLQFYFVPLLLLNNKSWNEFDDFDDPRLLVDWFKNRIKYTKMVLRALSVFSKSQTHVLLLVDPIAFKNNDISSSVNSILNYCSNPLHDANFISLISILGIISLLNIALICT